MTDVSTADDLRQLRPPVRNRYFYGKLLDVRHFEMEQAYGLRQRWLINRVGLGSGVLCGLGLHAADSGSVLVDPGVAVDGWGREIVVTTPRCIVDPHQPTDGFGRPDGDPLTEGNVTLYLCYTECDGDPTPTITGDCDSRGSFAAGSTFERYRIVVRAGVPDQMPAELDDATCQALFPDPQPEDHDLRMAACAHLADPCEVPVDPCVVLGTVTLAPEGGPVTVDPCTYRTTVYSNAELFELLACLAEHRSSCCDHEEIRYVSGDGQQGAPGALLADPLVVEVLDAAGAAKGGETVTFTVLSGGGQVDGGGGPGATTPVTSAADGTASVSLRLGPASGPVPVEATLADGARVLFTAWALAEEHPPDPPPDPPKETRGPPVILAMAPAPAGEITLVDPKQWEAWAERQHLELTFSRAMDMGQLEAAEAWLRACILHGANADQVEVEPVELKLLSPPPVDPDAPYVAVYSMRVEHALIELLPARVLVQVRTDDGRPTSAEATPALLDAEFVGSRLDQQQLDDLWGVHQPDTFPRPYWDGIDDTFARLPQSGDGNPGGNFHAWFSMNQVG